MFIKYPIAYYIGKGNTSYWNMAW